MKHRAKFENGPSSSSGKVVFTGGPGTGKTSLLLALAGLGFDVRSEIFTDLFAKAADQHALDHDFLTSPQLLSALFALQQEREALPATPPPLLCDRGMVDILAFTVDLGIELKPNEQSIIDAADYDLVFFVEPLPHELYVQNAIRRQSFAEALEHHENLRKVYQRYFKDKQKDWNADCVSIPFASVAQRVGMIQKVLSRRFASH